MAKLPDKFSLGARPIPGGGRGIVAVPMSSPIADAGIGLGAALGNVGAALHRRGEEEDRLTLAETKSDFMRGKIELDAVYAGDPDHASKGARYREDLDKLRQATADTLSEKQRQAFDIDIGATIARGQAAIDLAALQGQRQADGVRIDKAVQDNLAALLASGNPADRAVLLKDTTAMILDGVAQGNFSPERGEEMRRNVVRSLDRKLLYDMSPADRKVEYQRIIDGKPPLQAGISVTMEDAKAGIAAADAQIDAQTDAARARTERDRRETVSRQLVDRFGSAPASEQQALAAIDKEHGGDRTLRSLYVGKLEMLREQERRGLAQAAANAYRLTLDGREDEIDPADNQRLHQAGQMEGIFEAAQLGRSARTPGDLLFKERYWAMGPAERAGYGVAELAKRLSPRDFLEVTEGATGDIDETQRVRMEGFVQVVQPMLRTVTLGEYATPQEQERDRRLLGLINEEVQTLVADEEKKIGRPLTSTEYQSVMRRAANRALNVNLEMRPQAGEVGYGAEDATTGGDTNLHEGNVAGNAAIGMNEAEESQPMAFPAAAIEPSGAFANTDSPSAAADMPEGGDTPLDTPEASTATQLHETSTASREMAQRELAEAKYNVATRRAFGETDASSGSEPRAYLTNAAQTDDPDFEEGDGESRTLLAQAPPPRGGGGNRRGPGGRPLSTEEILRVDSYNRATQRITVHKRDYTELRPEGFVPTPRQLERKERQANAVEFFAARNIELDTHAMIRFGERENRVTLPDALRAYNTGRLYYDIKYRTYIRYDVQTGVWVSTSAPRGGQILTVAQGNNPSPRWQPVPYR